MFKTRDNGSRVVYIDPDTKEVEAGVILQVVTPNNAIVLLDNGQYIETNSLDVERLF